MLNIFREYLSSHHQQLVKNNELQIEKKVFPYQTEKTFFKKLQLAISVHTAVFDVKFADVVFFFFQQVKPILSLNFFNYGNFHVR